MNCRADNLECIVTIGKTRVSVAPIPREFQDKRESIIFKP